MDGNSRLYLRGEKVSFENCTHYSVEMQFPEQNSLVLKLETYKGFYLLSLLPLTKKTETKSGSGICR